MSFGAFTVPQADLSKGKKLELKITFTQNIIRDTDYYLHIILRTTDTPTFNIYDGTTNQTIPFYAICDYYSTFTPGFTSTTPQLITNQPINRTKKKTSPSPQNLVTTY